MPLKIDMSKLTCLTVSCLLILFLLSCSQNAADPPAEVVQSQKQAVTPESQTSSDENESAAKNEDDDDEFGEFEEEFKKSDRKVFDPLSGYNRAITVFNDKLYLWVLDPVAEGYRFVIPRPVRRGVDNFFLNLLYPVRLVNNLLQLKVKNAGEETIRFVTNTTIGVFGFWDPAEKLFGLEAHHEDFGQTLGYYGVGGGFHIVLPVLGPSNLRDTLSMYPDQYARYGGKYYLDTLSYLEPTEIEWVVRAFDIVNYTSLHIGEYQSLKKDAFDWYLFLRDAYEQKREKEIKE